MPVNTMNWSKCFTTYSQTHEYESLLPEKDDARAFTGFAEHQANYNVACHELCFPRLVITTNGPLCNGLRMPTLFKNDGDTVGIGPSPTGWPKHQLIDNNDLL